MASFGSPVTLLPLATLVLTMFGTSACGGATGDAKGADDEQMTEMRGESGFGGDETSSEEDVEPADHDIEVPPAP